MTKHTPGPWYCVTGSCLQYATMPDGRSAAVITYGVIAQGQASEAAPANARLIAAAPDMAEALQFALRHIDCHEALIKASAALEKAGVA